MIWRASRRRLSWPCTWPACTPHRPRKTSSPSTFPASRRRAVQTARRGELIAGIGALKELGGGAAELKSMRTHPDCLRQGVAAALLDHIIGEAKTRGLTRLSLETGRGPAFEPALSLYRNRGFADGEAFADYQASDFSQFLHMDL
jgi:putative acetyltransferase